MDRSRSWRMWLAGVALAATVASAAALIAGCAQTSGSAQPAESGEQASQGQEGGSDASGQDEAEGAEEAEPLSLPEQCTDRHGDLTTYAVSELDGATLDALLEQQGYAWNERNQMWVKEDGASALVVNDADGEPLSREVIAALGVGSEQDGVSYRLVTSRYSTAKRVFRALADKVVVCEDVEYLDTSGVGVVSGPSGHRCLVFVSKSNEVFVVSVFGEQAVAAGLFDDEAGQELGATIDEAFQSLTGRLPGEL